MAIRRDIHQERHRENTLHTIAIVATLGLILCLIGWLVAGWLGLLLALVFAAIAVAATPRIAPALIFRFYKAVPLTPERAPGLYQILTALSKRAKLPAVPTLYYIPSNLHNAFATGTEKHSAIGITHGILQHFNQREVTGILAHEVSHIKNHDTRVMALADTLSRLTTSASQIVILLCLIGLPLVLATDLEFSLFPLLLLIAAPWVGNLLQLGLSRTREYAADLEAARLTGDPQGLASALRKLERFSGGNWETIMLPGRRVPEPSLLRTHPPIEDRVARLLELRVDPQPQPWTPPRRAEHPVTHDWQPPALTIRRPAWHLSGLWY